MLRVDDQRLVIPRPRPIPLKRLEAFWRTTRPELTTCGQWAWGEPSAGSLWKIWKCLRAHVDLSPEEEVLLDWGAGAGKMLASSLFFFPVKSIVGMECTEHTFEVAMRNLSALDMDTSHLKNANAASVSSWDGVTIAMQYDAGPQPDIDPVHMHIMTSLLLTPSVKAVFSTRMNPSLFKLYFVDPEPIEFDLDWVRSRQEKGEGLTLESAFRRHLVDWKSWRCVRIVPGLNFGGSRFIGHWWIRQT